ncbi:hypothetical protein [Marinobacterium jannaschii]|uniref:hypothetical protein n=1 Tax=Marinobacterium jannaschii TaxID=64970 RepID=UPI0004864EA6|nr:hypothetical protein [Marinobacterium jannaschii]
MLSLRVIAMVSATVLISACSNTSTRYNTTAQAPALQEPLEAAGQWQQLANDEANKIGTAGVLAYPVYIQLPAEPSPFEHSYRDLLTSQLLQRGATVVLNPDAAKAQISYRVQLAEFQQAEAAKTYNAVITTQVRRQAQVLHSSSHIYNISESESVNFRE